MTLLGWLVTVLVLSLILVLLTNHAYAQVRDSDKKPLDKKFESSKTLLQKDEKIYILLYQDDVNSTDIDDIKNQGGTIKYSYNLLKAVAIYADDVKIQKIKSNKKIQNVFEDQIMYAFLSNSVPHIGANTVQSSGITGSGVKVCVVDTGIDDTHPSLNPLTVQYDFVNGDNDATDDQGHGTHVAGIIASRDSFYKGVAPDASLMAAKVLGNTGSGSWSNVIAGIDWCVTNGADVINLSLGGGLFTGTCDSEPVAIAVNNAVDAGVVVAVATGNDGFINAVSSPACASKVIAVGAVYTDDARTPFSNEGPQLDVVAPGVAITSLNAPIKGGGFVAFSGTSMATPHVAGLAALLLDTNPSLTSSQISTSIKNTALDLGTVGFDTIYGFGRIQSYDTYQDILSVTAGPPEEYGIALGDGEITITWTTPELGGISDSRITGYKIYRGNPSGFIPITTISGSGSSSYKDIPLTNGSQYCYYLAALIGSTEGLPTTIKCYTPHSFGSTVHKVEASNFVSNTFGHLPNPILVFGTSGQFAYYEINVPSTGLYDILIYGENDTPGPVDVQVVLDGVSTQIISFSDDNNEYTEKTAFSTNLSSGTHTIEISFLNDFSSSPSNDRNYLHRWIRVIEGTAPPPSQYTFQAIGQTTILGTCGMLFPNGNVVNYGPLSPDQLSSEITLNMTNTGSTTALLEVRGTNWEDTPSNTIMNVNRTHYNVTSGLLYSSNISLESFDKIVTNSFLPSVWLQTFWQIEAILNQAFSGDITQTMDFTVSC